MTGVEVVSSDSVAMRMAYTCWSYLIFTTQFCGPKMEEAQTYFAYLLYSHYKNIIIIPIHRLVGIVSDCVAAPFRTPVDPVYSC